ncbi:hypothetical protein scyTo_0021613, partial [Scyliorhinus torazame]|nr:hypothetical protein [Scyliorhinus torazame]
KKHTLRARILREVQEIIPRVPAGKLIVQSFVFAVCKQIFAMDSLTAANTRFVTDLFKKISEGRSNESIFLSPLSISAALAMVYLGAKNNTADEMAEVSEG